MFRLRSAFPSSTSSSFQVLRILSLDARTSISRRIYLQLHPYSSLSPSTSSFSSVSSSFRFFSSSTSPSSSPSPSPPSSKPPSLRDLAKQLGLLSTSSSGSLVVKKASFPSSSDKPKVFTSKSKLDINWDFFFTFLLENKQRLTHLSFKKELLPFLPTLPTSPSLSSLSFPSPASSSSTDSSSDVYLSNLLSDLVSRLPEAGDPLRKRHIFFALSISYFTLENPQVARLAWKLAISSPSSFPSPASMEAKMIRNKKVYKSLESLAYNCFIYHSLNSHSKEEIEPVVTSAKEKGLRLDKKLLDQIESFTSSSNDLPEFKTWAGRLAHYQLTEDAQAMKQLFFEVLERNCGRINRVAPTVLKYFGVRDVPAAVSLFNRIEFPTPLTLLTMYTILCDKGELSSSLDLYERLRQTDLFDDPLDRALIERKRCEVYAAHNELEKIQGELPSGFLSGLDTLRGILRAFSKGKHSHSARLFYETYPEIQEDSASCYWVIQGYLRNNEANEALSFFKTVTESKGVKLDENLLNGLLGIYVKMNDRVGVLKAVEMIEHQCGKLNKRAFFYLLGFESDRKDNQRLIQVFGKMLDQGIQPTPAHYLHIMKCFATPPLKEHDSSYLVDDSSVNPSSASSSSSTSSTTPSSSSEKGTKEEEEEEAKKVLKSLWKDMNSRSVPPDRSICKLLIDFYCRIGDEKSALEIREWFENTWSLRYEMYSPFLSLYLMKDRDRNKAGRLLEVMKAKGLQVPSLLVFQLRQREGRHDEEGEDQEEELAKLKERNITNVTSQKYETKWEVTSLSSP